MKRLGGGSLFLLACITSASCLAEPSAPSPFTTNMYGVLGLNTVPSARMDAEGTSRMTLSRFKDYTHAALGFQLTDQFYIGLRQTAQSKNLDSDAEHLYPGLDARWMLYPERRFVPQITVGVQSAFGHKRMAAEYLALSKRYEDFDFTFGFAWGRLATQQNLPNPLLFNRLQSNNNRDLDGEDPNTPADWFKGDMAFFGGVEYATPVNGLSFKADWNGDGWKTEKAADNNFKAPAPWSVGFSYKALPWMDAGLAYAGENNIMGRISLSGNVGQWPWSNAPDYDPVTLKEGRPRFTLSDLFEDDDDDNEHRPYYVTEENIGLTHIFVNGQSAEATLTFNDNLPAPKQIGDAARYLSNIAGPDPEQIILHTRVHGLQGTDIIINRGDFERAFLQNQGSPEEIWHNTSFRSTDQNMSFVRTLSEIDTAKPQSHFKLQILNDVSLSEEDSGILYRTALGASYEEHFKRHFISFQSVRLNLKDNLEKLNLYRGVSFFPIRGDIDAFTQNRILFDRNYFMGLASVGKDIHMAASFGYLEEMYMGLAGEMLYRPFGKNWAVGLETALAFKRDPYTFSALAPNGDRVLTGFLNGYYEVPGTGTTMKASVGRFLGGDFGGTLGAVNQFKNGVKLGADISLSNKSDADIYGDKTNLYTAIRLTLPLGSLSFVPDGSDIVTNAAPLGRDTAQRLDNPTDLYERTEPLSYRHITQHWSRISPH